MAAIDVPAPGPGQAAGQRAAGRRSLGAWDSPVTSYYVLVGASTLLVVLGLVMVLSSSSVESIGADRSPYAVFASQALYAVVGTVLAVLASRLPPRTYRAVAWPVLGAAVLAQLLVFVPGLGKSVGGNRNWIVIAGFSIQPSEIAKLALAIWLGAVLARKRPLLGRWQHALIPALPGAALMIGLVLVGHDLGTALVMIVLVAGALFVAGVPLRMFGLAGVAAVGGVAALTIASDNRTARIASWLSDDCDVSNACYQTLHGTQALATGGWAGLGLGQSREKWSYLPEAHNDFIFAVLGEELGLIGTVLVLGLFALLALAMLRVIRRHPDPFVQIATGGIMSWVIGQALLNIGVVIGLFPVIGVPLPLVSAGGSALIMTMAAMGVLVAFARTEPGAAEALQTRSGVVRRSLAVIGRVRG